MVFFWNKYFLERLDKHVETSNDVQRETKDRLNIKGHFLPIDTKPDHIQNEKDYYHDDSGNVVGARLRLALSFMGNEATRISININSPAVFFIELKIFSGDLFGETSYHF